MLHGRSFAAIVPAALALLAPAAAGAACAQRSVDQIAREAPIVVTAKAQPGPVARNGVGLLSPATFKVVAYDQGTGPQEIKVETALTDGPGGLTAVSEGVNPMAGQTWRLWGTLGDDGVLQTNVCLGSTLAGVAADAVAQRPGAAAPRCARRPSPAPPHTGQAADAHRPARRQGRAAAARRPRRTSRCPRRSRGRSSRCASSAARRPRRVPARWSAVRRRAQHEARRPGERHRDRRRDHPRRVVRGAAASRLSFSAARQPP